ncbi:efflux RND transporter periplasmic adaptor subunit [Xanthomonas campestris pv. phormiicola]|nr:efflux RND transporter periplasmic adaptor subunit [Xanthomonas campestris pv. phormiicola]UYC15050.1 efflux RND transporter periplasmic adaptor subunit [Xanthomonas campestris pv. phormiicola]
MSLFRDEVFQAKKNDNLGGIRIPPPKMGWLAAYIAASSLITLALIFFFGSYTKTETAEGILVPTDGQLDILPPKNGLISQIFVHEGDLVKPGAPLFELTENQESVSLGDTKKATAAQLIRKLERLDEAQKEQKRTFALKSQELINTINLLANQKKDIEEQLSIQANRAQAAMELYKKWQKDAQGIISGYQIGQQYDTAMQHKATLASLSQQRFRISEEIMRSKSEMEQLPATLREKLLLLDLQMADVEQARLENAENSSIVIRASKPGRINNIMAKAGQVVNTDFSLMTLVADASPLEAELWIPDISAGLIRQGSTVSIEYAAFPKQTYGLQLGHVKSISLSPVPQSKLIKYLGQEIKGARFRILVELSDQSVSLAKDEIRLKPGMSLKADIVVGKQKIRDLFKPNNSKAQNDQPTLTERLKNG